MAKGGRPASSRRAILLGWMLVPAIAAGGPARPGIGWDSLLPGTAVRGLSETPAAPAPSSAGEARIYVGNVGSVSPPNCLVYDFADWPEGKTRGYAAAIPLSSAPDGRGVFSLCFRRESGAVSGEIRGYYGLPGSPYNGVKRSWPFLWLTFDDLFSVKAEGRTKWQTVRVGTVLPHVWHRATLSVPAPGETNAVARATLERLGPDGQFTPVGAADIHMGALVLKRATSFDLTGAGPCKFLFDNLEWTPCSDP